MEYKLCKDNMICCDDDCRRCANLVHEALTNENKKLKDENDKLRKQANRCDRLVEAHNNLYDAYWDVKGERDRIHDELKELKNKKMVPLSEVYRIIAGHSDYHGNSILSALTCIAEGKEVGPVTTYEPINEALTDENKSLKKVYKELEEKCAKLEKENAKLDKECEKLHSDNQRLAHECRYYIERESNLVKENDKLRTMNSELIYRNGQLMKKSDPVIFQHAYGELSDKIESLKEDIIRLDKCLSNRPCVKEERYGE